MSVMTTRITVSADGVVSLSDPLPAGDYDVMVVVKEAPKRPFSELKTHPGHWDDSISLRREDMYGDDGRSAAFSSTQTS